MLYIHIPFCKGKCIYCDFYSGGNPDWKRYNKALVNELSERIGEIDKSLSSVYIGGGTPSLMPAKDFTELMSSIKEILSLNNITFSPSLEFTIEVNPEDVDEEKITVWKNAGVNRISMGIQSLDDELLKLLHRRHDANRALNALRLLKTGFDNISVDIIYGIPGQTIPSIRQNLESILSYSPDHISAYALTYEEGTPMWALNRSGKFPRQEEEVYINQGDFISEYLESKGYERYELSNYCLAGCRSRHNSGYWKGSAYLGLGPSAASYDGIDRRKTNPHNLKQYLNRFDYDEIYSDGKPNVLPFYEEESLSTEELMEEMVMVALRTADGIDLNEFEKEFGKSNATRITQRAEKWISAKKMTLRDDRIFFNKNGWHISDYIILDLLS